MKKLKTNKLFYNKWTHRVACIIDGGYRIKYASLEQVRTWCMEINTPWPEYDPHTYWAYPQTKNRYVDREELLKFSIAVEPFLGRKDVQIRVEGRHFNLFCKDQELFNDMVNNLHKWIVEVNRPETLEDYEFLLGNNKKVLCDYLPHYKYKYKVNFKSFVSDKKKDELAKFFENKDKKTFKISNKTEKWMTKHYSYLQDPFIYLTDNKNLSFLILAGGDDIKRIDEFIVRS